MSTKRIILLVVLILIILIGLSYCAGRQLGKFAFGPAPAASIAEGSWLNVNPSSFISEYDQIMPLNLGTKKDINSVQNMTDKIARAKHDGHIRGLLIQPFAAQLSLAALHEIGLGIQDFKTSGKPVVAFGDMMSHADYLLASYADEVYMEPSASAGLLLSGSSANVTFYKELFDKIGIKMHVIQAGEFKGAGEPYSQTSLSEGTRQNIEDMLRDRFNLILDGVAQRRNLTFDDVKAVYNNRDDFMISAKQAVEMRLIDHAKSKNQMYTELGIDSQKVVGINAYTTGKTHGRKDKVAVVYLSGNIMPAAGTFGQSVISHQNVKKTVNSILDDPKVKSVVIRVDSPGGSALESELIYRELLELKAEKPILISMGGVAASGGYYISCAADHIVADPGTMTGSIGVIMLLPEATGLGRKLGLRSQTIKFGKYAGALDPLNPYPSELIASLKRSSQGTYDEFKSRVMTARDISPDKINSIAEGRIYSAEDALAIGLVDELGSLDYCITKAAEMAEISDYQVEYFPRKISFFEALKDSDFLTMQISSLLPGNRWDPQSLIAQKLEHIRPGEWLYLMPVVVD